MSSPTDHRVGLPWKVPPGSSRSEAIARRSVPVLGAWFLLSLLVFAFVRSWGLVAYLAMFCGVFGSIAWCVRGKVRPALARVGLDNVAGFLLLSVSVTSLEEVLSYLTSGPRSLAIPNLPLDLLWINVIWLGWLLPWYLGVARRFQFGEVEALWVGGSVGILYEVFVSRVILKGALALLWVPFAWVVYATAFVLPLQLVAFPPRSLAPHRLPWTLLATWGTSLVVGLVALVLFTALGLPS